MPTRRTIRRVERAVRCLLGAERKRHGLGRLRPSARLSRSARLQTYDMAGRGYYGHRRRGGPTVAARLHAAGQPGRAGEILYLGIGRRATPRAVVAAWMASPRHRKVILRPWQRVVGVGVVPRAPYRTSQPAALYTAHFGSRVVPL